MMILKISVGLDAVCSELAQYGMSSMLVSTK